MINVLSNIFSFGEEDCGHFYIKILGIKLKFKKNFDIEYYNNLPVDNNKIVLNSVLGSYNCNPKYIAEEILRRKLPYKLVWICNKDLYEKRKIFPKNIKPVKAPTGASFKEYATAKIWVNNERMCQYTENGLQKKKNQIYIQTWHGSLGIKKTASDRNDITPVAQKSLDNDSKLIDYLISNSEYSNEFYKRVFANNGKILKYGYPRNDLFFKNNEELIKKIKNKLKIDNDKKIILYAPTFRENFDLSPYDIDFEKTLKAFEEKLNAKCVIALRLHPRLLARKKHLNFDKTQIKNVTTYPDMQELMLISDVLITDYSSCIYDFVLSKKAGFIYATDIQEYDNGRGLYYPLSETPFPVAKNNDELVENIKNFDYEDYYKKVDEFLKGKGCIEDGNASKRVVDLIEELMAVKD